MAGRKVLVFIGFFVVETILVEGEPLYPDFDPQMHRGLSSASLSSVGRQRAPVHAQDYPGMISSGVGSSGDGGDIPTGAIRGPPPPDSMGSIHREGWKWWRYHDLSEKEILDHLVHRQRYDKRERPPTNGPLGINVSVSVVSVEFPPTRTKEPEETVWLDFYLEQTWFDPRLIYNEKHYASLNGIHHFADLWLPDPFLNGIRIDQTSSDLSRMAINIFGNGTVFYNMRCELTLTCVSDHPSQFPFDHPICSISLESVSHSMAEVLWSWSSSRSKGGVSLETTSFPSVSSNPITLGSIDTDECRAFHAITGNHSCLVLHLHLERNLGYYLLNNFCPDVILVFCSFLTFWIDHQSSMIARLLLASLILFNFSTIMQFNRWSPSNALQIWHLISLVFAFASCVQFVIINTLSKKHKSKGSRTRETLSFQPFQNELRRSHLHHLEHTATLRPHHHHIHAHQLPQNLGSLHGTSMIAMEGCSKCLASGSSPLRGDFGNMTDPADDSRSIGSSGLFDRKILRDDFPISSPRDTRNAALAKKIDRVSRILFPVLYIVFVVCYFIKYLT